MNRTGPAPSRRGPQRAAKIRGAAGHAPTPRRPTNGNRGGRVTRSSAASVSPPAPSPDDSDDQDLRNSTLPHSSTKRTSPAAAHATRKSKRARLNPGYYDEASDEDEDDGEDSYLSPATDVGQRVVPIVTPTKSRKTKVKSANSTPKTKRTPKAVPTTGQPDLPVADPGKIPPWAQLPYFNLVQIFEYAAPAPLDSARARWLLGASRVCRAFAEPALTALYKNAPLLSITSALELVSLLDHATDATLFKYQQKIERLELDVENVVSRTSRGRQLDLGALIRHLPRLKEVDLWHRKDNPPYRELDGNLKWRYPLQLFEAFGVRIRADGTITNIEDQAAPATYPRLHSWRWNSRMLSWCMKLETLRDIHTTPSFAGLRKLSFVNFQLPSLLARDPEDPAIIEQDRSFIARLTESIKVLPQLTHLTIESSTAVNDELLPLLPKTLQRLELINCWDIRAEDFAAYLLSNGSGLRHLELHHNQSLSLAFLPVLGAACPKLESLSMDLNYYKHHEFYRDSQPCYDALLTAGQIPTWPSTLQSLKLKNLRKWDAEAAEHFFQSLVDSAPNLPMLRHLDIKAMLDIPFRQRSQIRDKWVVKLKKVFLRKWRDPLPVHSLRKQEDAGSLDATKKKKKQQKSSSLMESPSTRRSHRIATQESRPSSRGSSVGRDLRATGGRVSYAEPDTDEDLGEDEEDDVDDEIQSPATEAGPSCPAAEEDSFVQGMCDVVDIRFDNQKPVELQWHMEDFLDSEADDPTDDDWDGDRDVDDDYAW